jgi:drug/metabolite transporter (DMT)-like permease
MLSYLLVVLIWGSTWFAIKFQLSVDPMISVLYRFSLATGMSFLVSLLRKQNLLFSRRQHLWMALQGICLFSLNYILFYYSEKYIPSGLVAATFTVVIYFNMVGVRIFFGQPFSAKVFAGSLLGGAGILMLFFDSILNFSSNSESIKGLLLGIVATVFASAGNLISVRNSKEKMPILAATSWSLLYGSIFTLILSLGLQRNFQADLSASYLISLFYLAFFGTVVAFVSYLSLVAEIGADKAAYTNILTPVIALILSSVFENFHWQWWTWVGILLCGFGNYLALHWKPRKIRPQ